jgi:hypothetical protein
MYFAGFGETNFIRLIGMQWTILKKTFRIEQWKIIGFIQTDTYKDRSVFGLNLFRCNVSGKAEAIPQLFKLTNVSEFLNDSRLKCGKRHC